MLKSALCGVGLVVCMVALTLPGCGGGGSSGSSNVVSEVVVVEPNLQSSVTSYSFGTVTLQNTPAAKTVTLTNAGNAPLEVSGIQLTGTGFTVTANTCGAAPTLAAGSSCTVAVGFTPVSSVNYSGTLTITSNDPDTALLEILFSGAGQAVTLPTLHINQVVADTCPASALTVYLSVTDQEDYPISGLTATSFSLEETRNNAADPIPMTISSVINVGEAVSVALVMDYSQSITGNAAVFANMKVGAISFVNQLGANDVAEIIKFAGSVEVVQPFTNNSSLLTDAIQEPWDQGIYTRLNEALYQAVEDVAARPPGDRRAVILMTDGIQWIGPGEEPSMWTTDDVKNLAIANGVPIFAIGIGQYLDTDFMTSLTGTTGGQFFNAEVADDLHTAYLQLADLLFVDQYVLTYDTVFNQGDSAEMSVKVLYGGATGSDVRTLQPCP